MLELDARQPEVVAARASRSDEVCLDLDAARRGPGKQMHEYDGAPEARAEIDDDVVSTYRRIHHHRDDILDVARQVWHRTARQGRIGRDAFDAEHEIDPGIAGEQRDREQCLEKRGAA